MEPSCLARESTRAGTVQPGRGPIFATEACEYSARIGHGTSVINFGRARFAACEVPPDKALRWIAPMIMEYTSPAWSFLSSECSNNLGTLKMS